MMVMMTPMKKLMNGHCDSELEQKSVSAKILIDDKMDLVVWTTELMKSAVKNLKVCFMHTLLDGFAVFLLMKTQKTKWANLPCFR